MCATAQDLLAAFDALEPANQHAVAVEIFRRSAASGALPDSPLEEIALDIFQSYDAKEAAGAND